MKRTAFWALPLAASLALTGCSGLSGPTPSPTVQDDPLAASTESASASFDAPAPTENASDAGFGDSLSDDEGNGFGTDEGSASTGAQLSADELFQVAQAVENYHEGGGVEIVGDASLKTSANKLAGLVAEIEVDPAACSGYATSSSNGMLSHMNMVEVNLPADSNAEGNRVSIGSFDDPGSLEAVLAIDKVEPVDCAAYSLILNGREVDAQVDEGQANSDAATTLAIMGVGTVTATADGKDVGKVTKTLTVTGYDGVNKVAVDITNPQDVDAAVGKAEEYINLALLHISAA